ncbi:Bestrophin/UPF0187 family-containing protein [Aphelenchoides bicaudatus]|nr:Bestrophin/UPF0187 family-containing protein [Aphelenchoides bicaudatus]
MTVSYNLDVSSIKSWAFLKLIFRWKGSIWKSVYFEVLTWLFFYYIVMFIYRFGLNEDNQKIFAQLAQQSDKKLEWIPLTFMLGFFVSIVISRWQSIFSHIGFIDNPALFVSIYLPGRDEKTTNCRRNIMRYLCLAQVLVLRDVSVPVKKRFPTLNTVVEHDYLNLEEKEILESVNNNYSKYWLPINWCYTILSQQRANEKIKTDLFLNVLLQEIRIFRDNLQSLVNADWVPVPLAYPQVVYLAVRVYFAICIISRQHIGESHIVGNNSMYLLDTYVPFMTILQQLFYFGWLKVAEVLLNPLGEDDEDLETNFIIDRNRAIAMSIVDDNHGVLPTQVESTLDGGDPDTTPILVGSASQLILNECDDEVSRKTSFGMAARLKEQFQRRFSRAMSVTPADSPPMRHLEVSDGWPSPTHSQQQRRRPTSHTLHVSEPTNMPTIKSIDEFLEQEERDKNINRKSSDSTERISSDEDEKQLRSRLASKSTKNNDKNDDSAND